MVCNVSQTVIARYDRFESGEVWCRKMSIATKKNGSMFAPSHTLRSTGEIAIANVNMTYQRSKNFGASGPRSSGKSIFEDSIVFVNPPCKTPSNRKKPRHRTTGMRRRVGDGRLPKLEYHLAWAVVLLVALLSAACAKLPPKVVLPELSIKEPAFQTSLEA